MNRLRVSIARLMAFIVFVAVGIAALRSPTPLAASLLLTASLTFLAFASLAAIIGRGDARWFCVGTTIAGWGYLALNYGPLADARLSQRVATTMLIDGLYRHIEYAPRAKGEGLWIDFSGEVRPATVGGIDELPGGKQYSINVDYGGHTVSQSTSGKGLRAIDKEGYRVLGHSLFCPVIGLLGGIAAGLLAARNERRTLMPIGEGPPCDEPASPSPP